MMVVSAHGQGNGYGDGKVYVCLFNEIDWTTDTITTATFTYDGTDVTTSAIEAFRYGSFSEHRSLNEFVRYSDLNKKTVIYSDGMKTLYKDRK